MKLCEKCGTPQKDENFRCVECGNILPEPLSDKEEEIINSRISEYIDSQAERTEDFYVTNFDKIMIALDIIGFIVSVAVLIFRSPLTNTDALCIYTAGFFGFMAIDTTFPKILWFFEKLRVQMRYHVDDLQPSDTYLITRKIMIVVIPIIAYMILAYVLLFGGQ